MRKLILNVLSLLVISGGAAHLYAQTDEQTCCTSGTGAKCCGDKCRAGPVTCCANSACDVQPT